MHEVTVTYVVEPEYEEIMNHLSPKNIIEYAEMYGIEAHAKVEGTERITVSFEDETLELEFAELENGYEYKLIDSSGVFAQRNSKIIVEKNEETEISAETQYTLDTIWSFILDRLAASTVQQELETTIENLVFEVIEDK
jgi:hypothetical protein